MTGRAVLVSDLDAIRDETGLDAMSQLIAPGIHSDSPKMVSPVLLSNGGGDGRIFAREQEFGNLEAAGVVNGRLSLYDLYFSWVERAMPVAPTLHEALADELGDQVVEVGADMPMARFADLENHLNVVAAQTEHTPPAVDVYTVTRAECEARFAAVYADAVTAAQTIVADRDDNPLAELLASGRPNDSRFSRLDELSASKGLDAVVATSAINVQEVTARKLPSGTHAIVIPGSEQIHVCVPRGTVVEGAEISSSHESSEAAIEKLLGGAVLGVEDRFISISDARRLEQTGASLTPLTVALSYWRESRAQEDIAAYYVAAQASRHALEAAVAYVYSEIASSRSPSELDTYNHYLAELETFRKRYAPSMFIEPYFTSLHASDRTIYMSMPTSHRITADSATVRMDGGVRVGKSGLVLGASDLARSVVQDDEGRAAYALFTKIVREEVIPEARPGVTTGRMHEVCVGAFDKYAPDLRSIGMLPGDTPPSERYRRLIGHLMSRQESFVTTFVPQGELTLQEGVVGAVEVQWPTAGRAIGAEEMFLVREGSPLLLSA